MAQGHFGDPRTVEIKHPDPNCKCCFCGRHDTKPAEWGELLELDGVVTHYFCMLFSSCGVQRGKDNEGIITFLPNDIRKEVKRGKRLRCKFCKNTHATIGCVSGKCPYSFHYTCGYENGCLFEFYGQFKAFCPNHKPTQDIPEETCNECPICFTEVESVDDRIWPPCCGKQLFHRRCLLAAAKSAGYCFKCPLCNSKEDVFFQAMKANGVFIPEQDAAWERERDAYRELTVTYTNCDAERCRCPFGRDFNNRNDLVDWDIVRCRTCGSSATHLKCSNLLIHSWKCACCAAIIREPEDPEESDVTDTTLGVHLGYSNSTTISSSSSDSESIPADDEADEGTEVGRGMSTITIVRCETIQPEVDNVLNISSNSTIEQHEHEDKQSNISNTDESKNEQEAVSQLPQNVDNCWKPPRTYVIRKKRLGASATRRAKIALFRNPKKRKASTPLHGKWKSTRVNPAGSSSELSSLGMSQVSSPSPKLSTTDIRDATTTRRGSHTVTLLTQMGVTTHSQVQNLPPIPKLTRSQRVYADIATAGTDIVANIPSASEPERTKNPNLPHYQARRRGAAHRGVVCTVPNPLPSRKSTNESQENTGIATSQKVTTGPTLLRNPFANMTDIEALQRRLYNIAYGHPEPTSSTKPWPGSTATQGSNRNVLATIDLVDSGDDEKYKVNGAPENSDDDIIVEKIVCRRSRPGCSATTS